MNQSDKITIGDYDLVLTCGACPEQYDVFRKDSTEQVGYLRLRHGWFRADVPQCGGQTVYEACPDGDGVFEDDERDKFLGRAIQAIDEHYKEEVLESIEEINEGLSDEQ